MATHPDILELERSRSGEADPEVARHVQGCQACQRQVQALQRAEGEASALVPELEVPLAVEQRVLELAAARAQQIRARLGAPAPSRTWRPAWRWLAPAAAAAALVATLLLPRERVADPHNDVNQDGVVDIVDAMLLARAVEQGQPLQASWDSNADQRVDQADAEHIARAVVALGGEG